uniref:Retrovirus-related Pol polyprotein from transposon TNT 1-94 n=1 Tax=Tanacetum cinerariifolium TaxID=118510 RepID=A0A6L2M4T1_TANCI|nr:retrovirus-related Pol polyprotein from transposon TNT 1-94 [Tanacetum cinerariifolium]
MAFLTTVASLRFPSTNNHLITSSNLRNQDTIQHGRVTVQQVQGRRGQSYASNSYKGNATSSRGNNAGGKERVVKCYNYQGKGHMARQCTQPKRPRNVAWFKEKAMLAKAQEAGQILDEEQLAFLADPGIPDRKAIQTTILNIAVFQTEDLDAYDSDCDDVPNAKVVLMANLSNYGSDVISEKAQQIKPTLYDGGVISSQHVASPVIDDEETLILEELQTSHPNTNQSALSRVIIEAFKELPKITPDAITEGEWGLEQTKVVFLKEIILFLKTLKDIFIVFDKDLLNEDSLSNNQNALEIPEYFENNDLKAQLQAKDTAICCPDCSLVSGLQMLKTYDRESLSAHKLRRQFCDADLEVAFQKHTCFIQNLKGVDLLSGSRDINLYTICLDNMLKTSLICLLSKASKTKSWLWNYRLSHLNFSTLNKLVKDGLARGIPRLKFQKDHLCSTCVLGKSKKSSHQSNTKDTNQEKLYLLHMDLYGPMRVESINRKNEDLGKLNAKADIGIFVGYALAKKAFRIYNRRTQIIMKTSNVMFDELTVMGFKQFSLGLGLQFMTHVTSSLGLVPNPIPQQPCNPPNRDDWDHLFQPMFDEYFNPPTIDVSLVQVAAAPRAVDIADSPVSTSIDQDAPSTNSISQRSSSNVRPSHTPLKLIGRWTKDHPIANVIGDPSRSVSTREQLKTDDMWCYFDAFLTFVEIKKFKHAMTKPSWIDAMQEEIHEFKRLQVWELVSCLDKFMLIKLKWIYKVKTNEFGRNKGHLYLRSKCSQQEYDDLPNGRQNSFLKWRAQRRGLRFSTRRIFDQDNPSHVYKLKMALYGLKQEMRAWYDMMSSLLISQHFSKAEVDPTLFTQKAGNDLLLVQIYVDDIIFASTNTALCNEFANLMTTKFKMLMMG